MLSVKPWRVEALIRLYLGVFICVLLGALATGVMRGSAANPKLFAAAATAALLTLGLALALTRKPWRFDGEPKRLLALPASVYIGLALVAVAQKLGAAGGASPSHWQVVVSGIAFQGASLVLITLFLREHQLDWSEGFGFRNACGRAVMLGLLTTAAVLPIAWLLHIGVAALMTHFNVEADAQVAVQALQDAASWRDRVPLGIVAIVLAPPAEEVLFRGLMYPTIKRMGYPRLAIWGTALVFAAVHWNLASFPSLVLFALVLSWLYEKTDNLLAPIAAHSLFNALNFVALQLYDQAWTQPR